MQLKIHTEVWIAAQLLAQEKTVFTKKELMEKIREEFNDYRRGVSTHISSYCVASTKANPGKYRYLTRVSPGKYRLYSEGDETDRSKINAPLHPNKSEIPEKYHHLFNKKEKDEKKELKLYDFQKKLIEKITDTVYKKNNLILSIATGLGRNIIITHAIKKLFKEGAIKNALVIADRNILLDQFSNVLNENNVINYRVTTRIRNSVLENAISNAVYLSTIQRERKYIASFPFDLIVIDECHRLSENDWNQIKKSKSVVIGLSSVSSHFMDKVAFEKYDSQTSILAYGLEPIKLKEIANVSRGVSYSSADILSKGKYKFIRPRDVEENEILEVNTFVNDEFYLKNQRKALRKGDILLQNIFDYERMVIVTEFDLPSFASNNFFVIRTEKISPQFLFNYLQSSSIKKQFQRQLDLISTGATIRRINLHDVREIIIPLPFSEEQINWFTNLEKYSKEELIEINKQIIELKEALKKYQDEGE